jgi:Acetyltransferase (GNAT) domain
MFPRQTVSLSVLKNYTVERYREGYSGAWDDFVENKSINGTFLHSRKFYNHHAENRIDDHSFLFFKKNKLVSVIGCALQSDGARLISHPRSTYGGFIVNKVVGVEDALSIVQLFLEEAKKMGVKEIIIKNPFRIFYKKPCDEFDYALWYFGFEVLYRELEMAIPVDHKTNIETNYTEGTRSGVHKALKTLQVEESTNYKHYWELLERTLKERYQTTPTHSYEQFCGLVHHVGDEKIKLFVTKKEQQVIAGMVLFLLNEICVHAQYIAYDIAFQNERPLNILLHKVSKWAQEKGYRYFNLGRANEDNGNIVNFNLFKFKESYGSRGVLRETMHIKL